MRIATLINEVRAKGIKLWEEDGQLKLKIPKGALTDAIREQLVTNKSRVIEFLNQASAARKGAEIRPIDRARFERLPLSFAQERLWFINEMEPNSAGYNCPGAVRIHGELDVERLEEAFNRVIARHESLRTVFRSEEGRAYQWILESLDFKLERIDLSGHESERARDGEAKRLCQAEAAAPFDLAKGPLIRSRVIKLGADDHVLMLNMHHIVSDGWSLGVLIRELSLNMEALGEGRTADLAPLPIQYVDYSVWQRRRLGEGGVLERQLAYWKQKLAGIPESLDLATDYPRPAERSFAGQTKAFTLSAQLTSQLKSLAERQSCTLYMVLLAAFKVLLYRYTGQEDICVGSPIANRQYGETENLIGMFVNTLALRSEVKGGEAFTDLLSKVKSTCLEAYEHQETPFEKIVDALQPQRSLAISPIFQVMMVLQNIEMGTVGGNIQPYLLENGISKFDLSVEFTEVPQGLSGAIEYSTALYKERTIERLIAHFTALCWAITAEPAARIGDLQYLGSQEKRQLLEDFNDTRVQYPQGLCIHELFIEQARMHPEKTAVVCGEQRLSYRELHERSVQLAMYLQSLGVTHDSVVGLCVERSLEMMVGIMGIELAGGAYMPLDPDYPQDRLAYMLGDSSAAIVLTQEKLKDKIGRLLVKDTILISLDAQWPEIGESVVSLRAQQIELRRDVKSHHLSYVIYTSGSTGKPKGVMVEHRALVNRIIWMQRSYPLNQSDVVLQKTPYSFDVSVWEFFWPMMSGASVVFAVPGGHMDVNYLERTINESGVTTLHYVPSMLTTFLDNAKEGCPGVRQVFCSGEALDRKSVDRYRTKFANASLHNLYGPTEAAIDVTAYDCSRQEWPFVPIGAPIANTQIYILDGYDNAQPIGVPGELHIAGDGLARGYLNRPELTQQRFVVNPFLAGTRMYKTGDLARWLEDGNIEYLGRIDTQVKIRGFRIELGEIESRLNEHEQIEDSVVIAQGDGAQRQLVAFYRAGGSEADRLVTVAAENLRTHLRRTLPEYMVPAAFVSLAAIPLTSSGKTDRRALQGMDAAVGSSHAYVAPGNEVERQLVAIWAQVLNLPAEKIGVHDNFFELGGHSLLAAQLASTIRSKCEIDLPLKVLFEQSTVAQLAQTISGSERSRRPPIPVIDRARFERLPLSFAQERLWFINEMEPNSAGYNCPGAVRIHGELDVERLEEAFNRVIARHESLRTVFRSEEGRAYQWILESLDFKLERIDLSGHESERARDGEAKRLCQAEAAAPFDLAKGPLIRSRVIKLGADDHVLMLNMHHIVSDGWSLGVLIRELSLNMEALGEGRTADLAPLPIQYVDYSVWQRRRLGEGGVLERQLAYWKQKLAGIPESLDLATDYPRPAERSFAGQTKAFTLSAQLTSQLKSLAERQSCTLYMVLLAAFKVLLYRYTGQEDICVGSPIANRQYGETENLIGMFVNTLALRSEVKGGEAFTDLLSKVKSTCLEAYEHQETPFEKIVDALQPQRSLAISPIFQVMMVLQNIEMGTVGGNIQPYLLENGISKFDLSVEFTEVPQGLSGAIEYSTALYKERTIERLIAHFTALCWAITAEPAARIGDLQYLGSQEKRQLLEDFNDTRVQYPQGLCIHELFIEQARMHPEKTAVVCGEQRLSYRELHERSVQLAMYLQSLGVTHDSVVGLCVERSLEMMVGIMGIELAGGAYMPLDPDYPQDRLAYMLGDSSAAIVLTQEKLKDKIGRLLVKDTILISLDAQWPEIGESVVSLRAQQIELRRDVKSHHLSYVIYTSGSTGKPKGVMVEHRALVNRIIWMQRSYPLNQSDVVLQKTPYSFDVSVWEFFWPMMSGASVVFAVPGGHMDVNYLERTINESGVTTLHYVPSMLTTFLDNAKEGCPGVRQVFCSGEALDRKSVDRYRTKFANASLHNLYGPTEAAIDVTAYDCSRQEWPFVPIGAPIANTQIYILDGYDNAQPIGVPGELHIAGDGLARGYLNRPELTQQRFVVNPFLAGTRMYKTGDLARWLEDGNIEYLGRIDTQVKIRGFRIELGEIESRLNEHEQIEDSVVIAQGDGAQRQLVAFYRAGGSEADRLVTVAAENLRTHLRRTLPEYMVPAAFVSLAAIPLTSSGKTDRRALQGMDAAVGSSHAYVAPGNEVERQLVAIWAQVLNLPAEKIGVHDNFFELGGHSLLAVQLMAKINRQFGQLISLATLFTASSVAALTRSIESRDAASFAILVPIQSGGDALPFFAVPGAGGNVLSMLALSRAMGTGQPFYGLQAVGLDGTTAPFGSVKETAEANIEAMRTIQKTGPYRLIGHSYGGLVAFEMARILIERRERIASLVLLDSFTPSEAQDSSSVMDEAALLAEWCSAFARQHRVELHLDADVLGRMACADRVEYVVDASARVGLDITHEQFSVFHRVMKANEICARSYKPAPMTREIDASLYRAVESLPEDPVVVRQDYGWNRLLMSPVRVYDVRAGHFSMLSETHAAEIAREMLLSDSKCRAACQLGQTAELRRETFTA